MLWTEKKHTNTKTQHISFYYASKILHPGETNNLGQLNIKRAGVHLYSKVIYTHTVLTFEGYEEIMVVVNNFHLRSIINQDLN